MSDILLRVFYCIFGSNAVNILEFKNVFWLYILIVGVRVFANGPGDLGSIPGRVIPKTQKIVPDASLLNTQHYKVRIKGKVEQSREGVAPSPTHWCSSYRKREPSGYPRLWSPTTYIYMYVCVCVCVCVCELLRVL